MKIQNKIILITFLISSLFSIPSQEDINKEFDNAFTYKIEFVNPKIDGNHFGIDIDIHVKEGYYFSSVDDINGFPTRVEWPMECLDNNGDEFRDEDGWAIYSYEEDCIENNGTWIDYAKWIKNTTQMLESKKPDIKGKNPIQKESFSINQEYVLADDLEEGIYSFKGQFVFQVCNDKNCLQYIYGRAPTFSQDIKVSINKDKNDYDIHWEGKPSIIKQESIKSKKLLDEDFLDKKEERSLIGSFFIAILAGLIAIITPCVFPMIPMTVAFFAKDAKKGKRDSIKTGLLFGASIILIFTIVGVVFSALFGATLANELATSATANIFFAVIFLIFAISFFGYFEIRVPNKLLNKINKKADDGGLLGIFFMALTLVLVSFSCTAPIVGTVMIDAVSGNFIKPIIVMLGFSIAFAVPFSLFAIFPSWLESLPQSGGWLNSVKVVLGFIELALCIKFLSMPDQAYHWGILSRDIFLIIWILIFLAMGLYLLGYIKFENDSKIKSYGFGRLSMIAVTFGFCIYMFSGLLGGNLSGLAGIIPPPNYGTTEPVCSNIEVKYAEKLHIPHGLKGYFDFDDGKECGVELDKPLFLDFTGHACFNCRRMEENVWADPEVKKRLSEDYVIVTLYVDDKTSLSKKERYSTLGKKNFALQMDVFGSNAQPYYVLFDPKYDKLLAKPKAYDTNVQNFIDFLDEGKERFYKKREGE